MITKWTSHLKSEDEVKRFRNEILGSKTVLDRLGQMLRDEEDSLTSAEINPKIYSTPNWDYQQAHMNGYRACLKLVNKIINLDPKENNDQSIRPE